MATQQAETVDDAFGGEEIRVVGSDALAALNRSEIDIQIATAKRYPRSLEKFRSAILSMATLDVETAEGCYYAMERGEGDQKKKIKGPSVRLAEIAVASWGNLRTGSRVIAIEDTMVVAQGACFDLENNNATTNEVRRGIMTSAKGGRKPKRYGNDMIIMTGNAACSVAFRNAAFKIIPAALVRPAYLAAMAVVRGDLKTLSTRRDAALAWFMSKGAQAAQVYAWCGVAGETEIDLDHLVDLNGLRTAILDGETSIKEAFAADHEEQPKAQGRRLDDALLRHPKKRRKQGQ